MEELAKLRERVHKIRDDEDRSIAGGVGGSQDASDTLSEVGNILLDTRIYPRAQVRRGTNQLCDVEKSPGARHSNHGAIACGRRDSACMRCGRAVRRWSDYGVDGHGRRAGV